MTTFLRRLSRALALLAGVLAAATAHGQPPPSGTSPGTQVAAAEQQAESPRANSLDAPLMDIFDVIRLWRHPEQRGQDTPPWDYTKAMIAAAPVIGAKPASGLIVGLAGNVAFFRGEPASTHISTSVVAATYTTKKQAALSGRFSVFSKGDRWRVEGDNRAQWTSQDAYGLGTGATVDEKLNAKYDFFRVYETVFRKLRPNLFAGVGIHVNVHADVGPGTGTTDEQWQESSYVRYTTAHGFPLSGQTSAGASANLILDSRDNQINASRGVYANATYRAFVKDFLGGDSTWQELWLDARTYVRLGQDKRKRLAVWGFADLVTGGYAPYMDLPATAMDTYGRSGRGYGEGRFRGERMLYGEVEYRADLMRSGLVGWVAFFNVTTVTNLDTGERLFETWAPGGGAGLRLLINKRSKTNICLDVGIGKQGSKGIYLAIQEAF